MTSLLFHEPSYMSIGPMHVVRHCAQHSSSFVYHISPCMHIDFSLGFSHSQVYRRTFRAVFYHLLPKDRDPGFDVPSVSTLVKKTLHTISRNYIIGYFQESWIIDILFGTNVFGCFRLWNFWMTIFNVWLV